MTSNTLRIGLGFAAGAIMGLVVVAPAFAGERFNVEGLDRVRGAFVGHIELNETQGKIEVLRSIRFQKGGTLQLRGTGQRRGEQLRVRFEALKGATDVLKGKEAGGDLQLQLRLSGSRCWTRCLEGEQVVSRGHGAHPGQELTFAKDLGPKGVGTGKGAGKGAGKLQAEHKVGTFSGLAFIKGKKDTREIHPNDPEQGGLGDCYLISAMIALARSKPYVIRRLIRTNDDGTYTVRLYGLGTWGGDVDVKLDSTFPAQGRNKNLFVYGSSSDTKVLDGETLYELWPSLIEKAYAKHRGSYSKIVGGHADVPFEFLSGESASSYLTFFRSTKAIATLIKNARAKGYPICVGTKGDTGKLGARVNVVGSHVYVLWAVKDGGYKLYNPWQSSHPSRALTAAELGKLTSHIYVGEF